MQQSFRLIPLVLGALALAGPAFAAEEPKSKEDDAAIEAKLEAARERLEAAAREVAELSGQLSGPMVEQYFVKGGGQPRAILGVNLSGDADSSKEGVTLESVSPGGPASDAGLKAGDVLTSIDGKSLRRAPEGESGGAILVRHMRTVKPGDKVKLEYQREGKVQKAEVVTESMDVRRYVRAHPRNAPVPPMPPVPPGEPFMAFRGFDGHGLHRMELVTLTPKLGQYFGTEKGVLVVRAPKESELKVEEGDVILDIGGREPQSGGHALRILRSYQPGEKIAVNILRNRKPMKLEYTMPEREQMGDTFWFNDGEFFGQFGREERDKAKPRAQSNKAPAPSPPAGDRT